MTASECGNPEFDISPMDKLQLLIDFGSTFTKVVAVDLEKVEIVSAARVPSTVETDITIGLEKALQMIADHVEISDVEKKKALACSSASGGLRMVCVGFVPDLTSKAANYAALGAGAKVIGCYSYKLTKQEIEDIEASSPDIILLSGGTDGGDEQVIIHNAKTLAGLENSAVNIIVAGNKTAYDDIKKAFSNSHKHVLFTKNVMPAIGVLEVEPCNREIREVFLRNIIKAKGIARAEEIIDDVIMPTPSAVLEAVKLLANGSGDTNGFDELIVIDVGGATTDIHSIAEGKPASGVMLADTLPEPYIKRTVEGNLGLKHNIDTLRELAEGRDITPDKERIFERFHGGILPESEEEMAYHVLLSRLASEVAVGHHVGRLEVVYGPGGEIMIQHGKDFTAVKTVIGTGGPIIFSSDPRKILEGALFQEESPFILKPKQPKLYLDKHYILYAVGLLSQVYPEEALCLFKKYAEQV